MDAIIPPTHICVCFLLLSCCGQLTTRDLYMRNFNMVASALGWPNGIMHVRIYNSTWIVPGSSLLQGGYLCRHVCKFLKHTCRVISVASIFFRWRKQAQCRKRYTVWKELGRWRSPRACIYLCMCQNTCTEKVHEQPSVSPWLWSILARVSPWCGGYNAMTSSSEGETVTSLPLGWAGSAPLDSVNPEYKRGAELWGLWTP